MLQYIDNVFFQNPETNGLKRLLAVKKSLAEFEQNVEHVMKVGSFEQPLGFVGDHIFLYHVIIVIDSHWNPIENEKLHEL